MHTALTPTSCSRRLRRTKQRKTVASGVDDINVAQGPSNTIICQQAAGIMRALQRVSAAHPHTQHMHTHTHMEPCLHGTLAHTHTALRVGVCPVPSHVPLAHTHSIPTAL